MIDQTDTRERSVYSLGAADGLWIGLCMGLCVLCLVVSSKHQVLAYPGLALFICTPYIVWRFLRRAWIMGRVPATFSAVWLHGICIFLFGSLIMALIMYVSLKFLVPGWIEMQTLLAADRMLADPQTLQQGRILVRIVDSGELPSAIYTSISSIWLVSFSGSLWSMIFAFILARTSRFKKVRQQYLANTLNNGQ